MAARSETTSVLPPFGGRGTGESKRRGTIWPGDEDEDDSGAGSAERVRLTKEMRLALLPGTPMSGGPSLKSEGILRHMSPQGNITGIFVVDSIGNFERAKRNLAKGADMCVAPLGTLESFRVDPDQLVFARVNQPSRGYASPAFPGMSVQSVCNGIRKDELWTCIGVATNMRDGDGASDGALTVFTSGMMSINNTGPDTIHEGMLVAWRPKAYNSAGGKPDSVSLLGIRGWGEDKHLFETYEWREGRSAAAALLYAKEIDYALRELRATKAAASAAPPTPQELWDAASEALKNLFTSLGFIEEMRPSMSYAIWYTFEKIVKHEVAEAAFGGTDPFPMKAICELFVVLSDLVRTTVDPVTAEWKENVKLSGGPQVADSLAKDEALSSAVSAYLTTAVFDDRDLNKRFVHNLLGHSNRQQQLAVLGMEAYARHYIIGKAMSTSKGGKQLDLYLSKGII